MASLAMTIKEVARGKQALPLGGLNSHKSSQRLEQIARLRARGVGEHVGLPQLVVCGDQSTGKSSVLEGITGIPFPRQDGLCTTFPTEIILQHSSNDLNIKASIIPSTARSDDEKIKFREFTRVLTSFDQLPEVISEITKLFGLVSTDKSVKCPAFVQDVLRIEVTGSVGLHLSIVDLPGLIAVPNEDQTDDDVDTVHDLVNSYIANDRTIILAVVQAGNDIANQTIIKRSRKYDPNGSRTVGIITKPDLVNKGTEQRVALLAANRDTTKLKLGFFLVKNPTPNELATGITPEQRQKAEIQYFHDSPYAGLGLDPDRMGILSLQLFLQQLLDLHVEKELPKVREDIRCLLRSTEHSLSLLGERRDTSPLMRVYLTRVSTSFQRLIQSALNGNYDGNESEFFGNGLDSVRRLRANVHNLNLAYADTMRTKGHRRAIVSHSESVSDTDSVACPETDPYPQLQVTKKEMTSWIMKVC